jgi:hypothetical protein
MHWILQENLINPETRAQVEQLLRERDVPYTLARLVPIGDTLEHDIDVPPGPLFAYGSTGLGVVAREKGWSPGYFDANLDYQLMVERYGEHCVNARAVFAPLGELSVPWDQFFVRPILDNKSFPGSIMTREEFETFRAGVARVADAEYTTLHLCDIVAAAPLSALLYEYRFFIIGGKVITGSLYKVRDRAFSSPQVPPEVYAFAQAMADEWSPNAAFALDVAHTVGGLKVLELNSANSAGFYACDIGAIIDAVNTRLA